jgi:hypothetical protein
LSLQECWTQRSIIIRVVLIGAGDPFQFSYSDHFHAKRNENIGCSSKFTSDRFEKMQRAIWVGRWS